MPPIFDHISKATLKRELHKIYAQTFILLTLLFGAYIMSVRTSTEDKKDTNISRSCSIYTFSIVLLSVIFGRIADLLKN
jgi:hypothetical protein